MAGERSLPTASSNSDRKRHDEGGYCSGKRMKRVQYFHYGAPEELRLDDVTPPDAGRGQNSRSGQGRSSQPDGLERAGNEGKIES